MYQSYDGMAPDAQPIVSHSNLIEDTYSWYLDTSCNFCTICTSESHAQSNARSLACLPACMKKARTVLFAFGGPCVAVCVCATPTNKIDRRERFFPLPIHSYQYIILSSIIRCLGRPGPITTCSSWTLPIYLPPLNHCSLSLYPRPFFDGL